MTKRIAIVGAGTAGLHLGLYLQGKGVESTIFTDKKIEDYPSVRLLNTVAHHAVTVQRETALGVDHWPDDGYFGHYYFIGMPGAPIEFYGDLTTGPSRAVDYRIYLPRLMHDYLDRGGTIEYRDVTVSNLPELSDEYDLVAIGTGKGGLGTLFARDEQSSPFTSPQRQLCVGLFKGIAQQETRAVTFCISPGAGEMIEIPTVTFGGDASALVLENHPGSDLEVLAHTRYDDNPRAFLDLLLDKLRTHYPITARRINEDEFDLANNSLDLLQGAVTPTVRHGHVKLDNGKTALLIGDAHATVDPVLGQGGNMASYAAPSGGSGNRRHRRVRRGFLCRRRRPSRQSRAGSDAVDELHADRAEYLARRIHPVPRCGVAKPWAGRQVHRQFQLPRKAVGSVFQPRCGGAVDCRKFQRQ